MANIGLSLPTISQGMLDACQRIIESNPSDDAVQLAREIVRIAPEINGVPLLIEKLAYRLSGKEITDTKVTYNE